MAKRVYHRIVGWLDSPPGGYFTVWGWGVAAGVTWSLAIVLIVSALR
jgi:hypothetical protein